MDKIQQELDEAIAQLNAQDEEQYEEFANYRDELQLEEDKSVSIAELVRDADLDSTDFNIGFEQGYMRGLEVALSLLKNN